MKAVILIPTYNEATSIVELLSSLEKIQLEQNFNVVVLDDNSPDNTADIVDSLKYSWVQVLRRPGKAGLGAYQYGYSYRIHVNE